MRDWNQLKKAYIAEEKQRWHFLKQPEGIANLTYEMTEKEEKNQLCAVFSDTFQYEKVIGLETGNIVTAERYVDGVSISYACRYLMVGEAVYDLYKPSDIMKVPIPAIRFNNINGVPLSFINEHENDEADFNKQSDRDILIDLWNDDIVFERIENTLKTKGENAAIEEACQLSSKICNENGIVLPQEVIEEEARENIRIMQMAESAPVQRTEEVKSDYSKEESQDDELKDFLMDRVKDCFEPAIFVPLCYIAINHAISERTEFGLERIVAQAAALGEGEYAQYLDQELSKMIRFWKAENAIPYGLSLRKWAVNTREYNWLCDTFPDDAPKSKGSYTKAKNKRSKLYTKLKECAAQKGHELIDDVETYLQHQHT